MLQGSVVVVTGSGKGIGRQIAKSYLKLGAAVCLAEVDPTLGVKTQAELQKYGDVFFKQTDVSDEQSVRTLAQFLATERGKVDVLVNNAGVSVNKPISDLLVEQWDRVLGVNLKGPFLCVKYLLPLLKLGEYKAVINVASTRAFMSEPNTEAYTASKGGVVSLTHSLAVSLGEHRIRVNCISPGWIDTEGAPLRARDHVQHPAQRVGDPTDIADACIFLSSLKSGFITGTNLIVDGGMTIKMIYES